MRQIVRLLLQGLLYTAPLAITAYILILGFRFVDSLLGDILHAIFGLPVPGLGLLIIILLLILAGYFGQTIVARPLLNAIQRFIGKIPILNVVYSAFTDLFSAFVGKEKKFNRPVIVLVNPVTNLEKMGFLTEDDLSRIGEPGKVAIYFPHSYNFSGEMFIVPREQVRELRQNPSDVMKFVVSGGVAGFHYEGSSENGVDVR